MFELRDSEVDATHYNHVLVALKRLGPEIRLPLPRLKTLDLLLQKHAWIIVDRALNDIPVAAWSDFQTLHREDLHKPIKCCIRLYHAHAELILTRVLEAMELILGEELADRLPENPSEVLHLRDRLPKS